MFNRSPNSHRLILPLSKLNHRDVALSTGGATRTVSPHLLLPLFGIFTPFLWRSPVSVTVHPSWPACVVVFWWCEDGLIRIPVSDSNSDSVLGFLVLVGGFLGGELGGSLQGRWWLSPCLPSWFQTSSPFKAFDFWSFQICWDLQFSWLPIRRLHAGGLGFFWCFCSLDISVLCVLFLFVLFVLYFCLIIDWVTGDVTLFCGGSVM